MIPPITFATNGRFVDFHIQHRRECADTNDPTTLLLQASAVLIDEETGNVKPNKVPQGSWVAATGIESCWVNNRGVSPGLMVICD